jgi:2-amino-4-hydroxy-6-hydroxymethyldihydropteridine diphosphokinase
MVSRAFLSLGSNLGDRAGYLVLAIRAMLNGDLPVNRLSNIYETAPVDITEQPDFLNMVVELKGGIPGPADLLAQLLIIETQLGRTREVARGPRTIDIDLLIWDALTIATGELTLPHPRMHMRRFVLVPLAELAPDLIIPGQIDPIAKLRDNCEDLADVRIWIPNIDTIHPTT